MRKTTIIFSLLLGLMFASFLSNLAYAGFGLGLPSVIKERVKALDKKVGQVNRPPNAPSNPSPSNGATNQSINVNLSWTGGDPDVGDVVKYDVYFGTVTSPPKVQDAQSATNYDPATLSINTTYYWKILAKDNHDSSAAGPVWNFTTGSTTNNPPNAPSNPSPSNGAANQSIDVDLSWTGGDPDAGDVVKYDVYFGPNNLPATPVSSGQTATTYNPGTLSVDITYYWKIIATDNHDSSTIGPVWSFVTGSSGYTAAGSVSTNSSGVIETQSGAKINVPMYAVPTTETGGNGTIFFSIEVDTTVSPVVSETETIASDVYRFGPDGFVFASPIEITIPLKSVPDPSQEVLIYRVNLTTGELERYSGIYDPASNSISTQTYKFSPYFASFGSTANPTAAGAIRVTNGSLSKWLGVCVEEYTLTYPTGNPIDFAQASFAPVGTIGWTNSGLMILSQGTYRLCIEMSEAGTISSPPGPKSHIFLDNVVVDKPYTYTNPDVSAELNYSSLVSAIDGPCPCVPTATPTAGTGDVQVTLTWHSTNAIDLDLWVTDPSGEMCYYGNTPIASGGALDRDNECSEYINGKPENIFWSNAPGGEYKVEVNWFDDCDNAISSIPYEVRVRNKDNVKTYTGTITPSPETIEVCKFNVWGLSSTLAGNWKMTGHQRIFPDVTWEADLILYANGTLSWTETVGANVGANRTGQWEYDGNTFKMNYIAPVVGLVNWQSSSVTANSMSNGDYQTPQADGDYGGSWSATKQ